MPVYRITAPNGVTYQTVGPPGATPEQIKAVILRAHPEAGVPPQEENTLEKIPLIGGLAAGIADIPLAAVSGLAGVSKAGAEAFGADNAVADFFGDIAEGAQDWKSSGAREDALASQIDQQMAEGRGTWEELKAAGRSFLRSPLESTAQLAGSAVPFIAAGAVTGGAAVPALMGAVIGAGTIKGEVQDAVYSEFKKAGASEEQALAAAEKAQEYSGENLDQIGFGAVLGAVASATGFAPAIAKTIGARASARVAERIAAREAAEAAGEQIARKSLIKGGAKGVVAEALPESVQGGQEKYASNLALQREGFDVDPWAGVAGQAAAEGIASIFLGGYGGVRETKQENLGATIKQYAAKVEALPDDPTEEDIASMAEWAKTRGYNDAEAEAIAKNAAEKKATVTAAKRAKEEADAAAMKRYTDLGFNEETARTIVGNAQLQKEAEARVAAAEAAAKQKAREERTAGVEPIFEPDIGAPPPVDAEEQAAMERAYAAEAGTAPSTPPAPTIIPPLETITPQAQISEQLAEIGVAPPTPDVFANPPTYPTGGDLTPERANAILDDQDALDEYVNRGGDIETLQAVAREEDVGYQPKYSRGRRPKDTQTASLGFDLPVQMAPGEDLKRDEYNELRFASDEEKAAREQQFAEEMQAGQERALAINEREAGQRQRHLDFIQSILRAKAPENAVYKVLYEPEDTNAPYKLVAETQLGKKPELVLQAKTRQDFSDAVYERMEELTPYTPPAPAGIEEIEERESGEQKYPTVATRMVQDFTAEVDAAREAGLIDNLQRSELLQRLQRPNAYRPSPNGERMIPNDAIARLEKAAIDAASAANNASAEEQDAAVAAAVEANNRLAAAVKNSLLNPARAKLKSMVEMRQDEKLGAKVRIKEAERAERIAARDMRKEMKPGKGVLEADVTPERARVQEAKKEKREAKIDLAQQKVQKYRKGAEKQPGGPPKVVDVDAVQAMVDKITSQWKSTNPVKVVASVDDIPDAKLRRAIKRDKAEGANGLVAPDGTIYLLADNLLSMEDAKAVLFHEALGHTGLEKLFRNNLDNALVTMYRGNAQLKADTDKWRAENPDAYKNDKNPLARAIEEVLAERSEKGQLDRTLFQKIAAIVRNFARRMGINLKISDGDVAAILSMAHDKVVKGDTESTIVKGLRYVTAWHGSPHDFDKFTTEKIGTGEGAQIFGWGLYFTDTKQIAERFYRDRLSDTELVADGKSLRDQVKAAAEAVGADPLDVPGLMQKIDLAVTINSQYSGSGPTELEHVAKDLLDAAYSYQDELSEAERKRDARRTKELASVLRSTITELEILNKLGNLKVTRKSSGKLYNVELKPDDDSWLLWDEPLEKQSPKVIEAMKSLGFSPLSTFEKALERLTLPRALRLNLTGGQMYRLLTEEFMGDAKQASLALLAAGVRGNKYLDGNSRGMVTDTPGYNYVVFQDEDVELTAKYSRKKKKVVDAAAGLSAGRRRVEDTMSVYGMVDGIEEATENTSKLRDAIAFDEGTASPVRQKALLSMPTSGITGWLQRKSPAVYEVAEVLVDTVRKMNGLRVNLMAAGDDIVRDMKTFVRKNGSGALARAQFTNRINEIDFLAFDTMDEALAKHRLVKAIEGELLSNSNNKAETRKLIDTIKEQAAKESDDTSVLKDKVNLSPALRTKAHQLSKVAVDADKVLLKVKQLAAVTQRIRDSYAAKAELAKQKGGLELYEAEREYHKRILEARQALLDERIERGLGKEEAVRIRDIRARMMREMQSPTERQKAGDLFWDLDADLFDKEYFPMLRDGQYWLRVKEDLSKGREEQFYVFESARELAQGRRKLAKMLKEDPESGEIFESGNDIGELQNTLRESDTLMQRVFDIVGTARDEYVKNDNIDMRQLMDEIYQTWLMTTPERSARRHFMHAKQIAGFSVNTLGNLQSQLITNANELTKLAYAGRVRTATKAIKDTINDVERPVSEKSMLGDFARELELRAEQELNPPERGSLNTFVNALNRFSFYYYLTSAKTALTNFANIPMRVVPRFWREYGYAEGTAMWIKYMKMWDSLGRVKIERTDTGFGDFLDTIMPNVNGSNFVKNSEDLQWALKAGTERGILMTTADTMVHNTRANPLSLQGSLTGKLEDLNANVGKVMSFLFTGTENISRQATFYMAFELEMKKQAKENPSMPREQRREIALQKAMRIVDDTIGNFADWERPRIAKGEATRAFFLFKMHPILQTKFMVGAFRDIIAAPLRGAARQATGRGKMTKEDTAYMAGALKEFSGVIMMGALLGGVTGLPLYTIMLQMLAEGFDEEDDDDVRKLLGIDPRTAYDADLMFKAWVMEHLGTPEKGDVDFADIVLGGVPGAMTDTELAGTLTLDLVSMWYREPIAGDSLESTAISALIANVAGFSMVSQMLKAWEDVEKENTSAALKKLLPAFFRAPVAAYYSSQEGIKTRKGDIVIPKEDITGGDIARSVLGARSARLARWQDYYITAKKNEDRIKGEKVDILDQLERKIDSGEIATEKDFNKFWTEVVVPFNRTYPDPDLMITMDSIERSLTGRAERESRTMEGMLISKKSPEQERRSAEPFRVK